MLKCLFPYDNDPHQPGPKPHYCLVADIPFSVGDQHYVAVAYGTSKLDENLLRAHRGLILSVDSAHLKGSALPGPVSHFVLDHVALLPLMKTGSTRTSELDSISCERSSEGTTVSVNVSTKPSSWPSAKCSPPRTNFSKPSIGPN